MSNKISIRLYKDREVRAVWDEDASAWLFGAADVVGAINEQDDHEKNRNYWKYLKAKLNAKGQPVSITNRLRLTARDGKKRFADCIDSAGVCELAKHFPNNRGAEFLDWFLYSENSIDGQSKKKAYTLFESGILDTLCPGTVRSLRQIHAYIFGGIYDFAGKIRTKNISKGNFHFAARQYLDSILKDIEDMPQSTFEEITDKYIEMNVAHPFMEGNGRAMRIWLDIMLKTSVKSCIDWSKIDKNDYLAAMRKSPYDGKAIKSLLRGALTDNIYDREMFIKGIDYSYYYEEENA
ncbi:MAG: Fic family protein [Synergistes sp.]|nr:Fic family protein [Synergistes sp.]